MLGFLRKTISILLPHTTYGSVCVGEQDRYVVVCKRLSPPLSYIYQHSMMGLSLDHLDWRVR